MSSLSKAFPASILLQRPAPLDARLRPPGSKSLTNRALLLASIAAGTSRLVGVLDADDTQVMRRALGRLGVAVSDPASEALVVRGRAGRFTASGPEPVEVGTAGTVARFLTALLAAVGWDGPAELLIDGTPRMRERPMGQLLDALAERGAGLSFSGQPGHLPLRLRAATPYRGGQVVFERPASSQFISALVMAASFADTTTRIVLREGTPARPYVDMTLDVLSRFGGSARWAATDVLEIEPRRLAVCDYEVEPDASAASYFLALAAIHGGQVSIRGLGRDSVQGDAAFCHVLGRLGAEVVQGSDSTTVRAGRLHGAQLDLTAMPDMTLTAAVVALFAAGPTTINGVGILRHHESDRLAVAASELSKLGAEVSVFDDGLRIVPPAGGPRHGVRIDTYDDHRVAMAFSMVGDVEILDPGCVAKTFPGYFEELRALGMVGGAEG